MVDPDLPRDDDPSGMTDFEKNATSEEIKQIEDEDISVPPDAPGAHAADPPRGIPPS